MKDTTLAAQRTPDMFEELENKPTEDARRHIRTGVRVEHNGLKGRIAEFLVALDASLRCGPRFFVPESVSNTKDDLFIKTSVGWYGVQVKTAHLRRRVDGSASMCLAKKKSAIDSDILALVDFLGMRVWYKPWNKPLPPELPSEPTALLGLSVESEHAK